jgi:hypothetical protein
MKNMKNKLNRKALGENFPQIISKIMINKFLLINIEYNDIISKIKFYL